MTIPDVNIGGGCAMMEDVLCPPLNVPAAVTAIRARLDGLDRDVVHLRDRLDPREVSSILSRLDAMDRATELMHADYRQVPTDLDRRASQLEEMIASRCSMLQKQIDTLQKFADTRDTAIRRATDELRDIVSERFRAVDLRFSERDLRFSQIDADHQKAIEAALSAVNSASEKNERSFTKQIDGLQAAAAASQVAMQSRIDDLKERLSTAEGAAKGTNDNRNWGVALVMASAALATVAVAAYNVITMASVHHP